MPRRPANITQADIARAIGLWWPQGSRASAYGSGLRREAQSLSPWTPGTTMRRRTIWIGGCGSMVSFD